MRDGERRYDRVHPYTRGLALLVLPFLAVASVLLYLLPHRTEELFAWTIEPALTSRFLAAAYIGGIWYFLRVLRTARWHSVKYGMPAVLLFAALLGVATLLHWDRFHHGHISFIAWATLYFATPLLVTVALLLNWRADPGVPDERDLTIPFTIRTVLAAIGAAALLCGATLYVFPALAVDLWAWEATPLTVRVVGAILTLPGAVNLWLLRERRWSAMRDVVQAELVSLVFIALALVLGGGDLLWQRPAVAGFVVGIAASLLGFGAFYAWCERRLRLTT